MYIHKVVNNNIIVSIDESQNEMVLMGRGLAFNKKRGDPIDKNKIEKRFHLQKEVMNDNFIKLLSEIPEDIVNTTHEVIEYIRANLTCKIDNRIYITLLDHIKYALDRYLQGIQFNDMLLVVTIHGH